MTVVFPVVSCRPDHETGRNDWPLFQRSTACPEQQKWAASKTELLVVCLGEQPPARSSKRCHLLLVECGRRSAAAAVAAIAPALFSCSLPFFSAVPSRCPSTILLELFISLVFVGFPLAGVIFAWNWLND